MIDFYVCFNLISCLQRTSEFVRKVGGNRGDGCRDGEYGPSMD